MIYLVESVLLIGRTLIKDAGLLVDESFQKRACFSSL